MSYYKRQTCAAEQKADFICSTGSEVNMLLDAEGFQPRGFFLQTALNKNNLFVFPPYLLHIHSSVSST